MKGKINNSNKEKKYNAKFKNIEENLENRTKYNNTIKLYIIYLNQLKKYYLPLKNHQAKVQLLVIYLFFCLKYILIIIQMK